MNFDDYLDCLRAKLPTTGDLQVFYNFSSGEKDLLGTNADLLYNLKFPTGEHAKQVSVNGTVTGVIESNLHPGFSIGETDMPVTHAGYFSGVDLVQVGLKADYTGWSAVLDITPNLCDYSTENNLSRVLLSTMDSRDSLSGFHVGINQSNRLYLETKEAEKISYLTVNKEVNKNSIVSISQSDNELAIGVYDIEAESLERGGLVFPEFARSDKMYLGNFLNNTNTNYTGYEGSINSFALFDSSYSIGGENSTCQCMFSSGLETSTTSYEIVSPNITGFHEVTGYTVGVTGYVEQYKTITDGDGNTFLSSYQSGVTGLISKGLETVFLTGDATILSHNTHFTGVLYDDDKYGLYNRYFLNFKNGLQSGESLEILSFSEPRGDVNQEPDLEDKVTAKSGIRLYNYGLYRQNKADSTLGVGERLYPYPSNHSSNTYIEKDLTQTDEHIYDYVVNHNNVATGFLTEEQNIIYDTVGENAICIDFSGHYDTHKLNTGINTPTYYPPHAQFINNPNNDQGQVIITGISGQRIWETSHIYYNGQKLIEEVDYFFGNSEYRNLEHNTTHVVSGLIITGGLAGFSANGTTTYQGELHNSYNNVLAEGSLYAPQMCFVPKVSGEKPSIMRKSIQGCSIPPYCSDPQYDNIWDCKTPGTCSQSFYTDKASCIDNGHTWTHTNDWIDTHGGKVICEASGGIWEADGMDGIPDPLSGFNEMIWVNGVRQKRNEGYKLGRECSLSKTFTFFGEKPFIFYNNNEDFLNFS